MTQATISPRSLEMRSALVYFQKYLAISAIVGFIHLSSAAVSEDSVRPGGSYVYRNTRPSQLGNIPEYDHNGYVFFCLCMGRMGNQLEHFLGGLAFAKSINRTLVLPPFRTYRNVRFTEWFQFDPLMDYHRVILAEDFMEHIAPTHWPPGQRIGFCYQPNSKEKCNMKTGNPFGPFWDGLGVDFDDEKVYQISYYDIDAPKWRELYPASRYPVLAMRGAPAPFPMLPTDRKLQQYLIFSDRIKDEANEYISENFAGEKFVGLHLRNGADWENVCSNAENKAQYMASPQCLEHKPGTLISKKMCIQPVSEVLRLTRNKVIENKAKVVFVATDQKSYILELQQHLADKQVKVFHADPHLPIIDWAILIESDHFIGNCISSFSSFVIRARNVQRKPSSFWGMD